MHCFCTLKSQIFHTTSIQESVFQGNFFSQVPFIDFLHEFAQVLLEIGYPYALLIFRFRPKNLKTLLCCAVENQFFETFFDNSRECLKETYYEYVEKKSENIYKPSKKVEKINAKRETKK